MQPLSLSPAPKHSPTSVKDRAALFASSGSDSSSSAPRSNAGSIGLGLGLPNGASSSIHPVTTSDSDDFRVTSPQELTQFVDNLLTELESRFDAMSTDVLSRLSGLSTRVDSLEASIGDLMSGTAGGPVPGDADGPPLLASTATSDDGLKRSGSSGSILGPKV